MDVLDGNEIGVCDWEMMHCDNTKWVLDCWTAEQSVEDTALDNTACKEDATCSDPPRESERGFNI